MALEIDKYGVKLGHVDAEKNHQLVSKYVVNPETHMVSYPTLVSFVNGNGVKMPSHLRTADAILNWAVDEFKLKN